MASADAGNRRYYCHLCQRTTVPTFRDSTLTCGNCNQGFVEEVGSGESDFSDSDGSASGQISNVVALMHAAINDMATGSGNQNFVIFDETIQDDRVSANTRSRTHQRPIALINGVEFFLQMLMNAELNGLSGPPPASASDIARLPRATLSQSDLVNYDVCSICLEKYKVNEEINTLPCAHTFHSPCLATWLHQKGSCPICRKDLDGRDTS
uniref:RING-type E3 ubiquitin transferase n=1 Tax=Mesocestoides corti TaxID=53468 RepID=A0A5K3FWJ5_MESCO